MLTSILGAAALAVALYDGVIIGRALLIGGELAQASEAYTQQPRNPQAALLVVGDSTAVGTGAANPRDSLAGRLGAALPRTRIDNLAANGALTRDVLAQLERAPLASYDAVLVQVGGNDALRFTSMAQLGNDINAVLERAASVADYTALMSTGDLGAAPALPWPIDRLFSARSRRVREVFSAAAARHGADYVDLFSGAGIEQFDRNAEDYHAADGLHLSGEGYGIWYQRLTAATELPQRLL
jgi:lysophospholipase L1-like esterase